MDSPVANKQMTELTEQSYDKGNDSSNFEDSCLFEERTSMVVRTTEIETSIPVTAASVLSAVVGISYLPADIQNSMTTSGFKDGKKYEDSGMATIM